MAGHYTLLTQLTTPLLTSANARGPQDAGLKVHTSLINRDLLMPKLTNISKLAKIPSQLHNYCRSLTAAAINCILEASRRWLSTVWSKKVHLEWVTITEMETVKMEISSCFPPNMFWTSYSKDCWSQLGVNKDHIPVIREREEPTWSPEQKRCSVIHSLRLQLDQSLLPALPSPEECHHHHHHRDQ